jgi:flagellar hook assembly protein FlgD
VPDATFLAQNYPNPFNPLTTICFGVKKRGQVSLRIYDTAGRLVVTLIDREKPAGRYEVVWSGSDGAGNTVASGIYFYKLVAGDFVQTKKMVLLR